MTAIQELVLREVRRSRIVKAEHVISLHSFYLVCDNDEFEVCLGTIVFLQDHLILSSISDQDINYNDPQLLTKVRQWCANLKGKPHARNR